MVRVSLDSTATDEEIGAARAVIGNSFDELDGFEIRDHVTMDTVRTYVTTGRDQPPTNDEYIDKIVSTLQQLVRFSHPRFVDANL